MQITQLDALTYVGPQISIADIESLKRLGIRIIVVARPEGEAGDQPEISAIREAANTFGITVHQIPVIPGNITDDDVRAFGAVTADVSHPVFAYCRSGMRASSLWALNAAARGRSLEDILRATSNANHDLTALTPRLDAYAT
jgi:sulfide:quinone oxidoreductase